MWLTWISKSFFLDSQKKQGNEEFFVRSFVLLVKVFNAIQPTNNTGLYRWEKFFFWKSIAPVSHFRWWYPNNQKKIFGFQNNAQTLNHFSFLVNGSIIRTYTSKCYTISPISFQCWLIASVFFLFYFWGKYFTYLNDE